MTLAVLVRGRTTTKDAVVYMAAQIIAGLFAAFLVGYLKGDVMISAVEHTVSNSLIAEFLFTFALCFVVLNTATAKATEGNSYFGLAIGITVMVGAYAVGGVSGGAFNPAVAFGISSMGLSAWADLWIYLLACFLGGGIAGWVFKALNPEDA